MVIQTKTKNQGRKYVALVKNDEIVDENSEGNALGSTKEQYTNLLSLLDRKESNNLDIPS